MLRGKFAESTMPLAKWRCWGQCLRIVGDEDAMDGRKVLFCCASLSRRRCIAPYKYDVSQWQKGKTKIDVLPGNEEDVTLDGEMLDGKMDVLVVDQALVKFAVLLGCDVGGI